LQWVYQVRTLEGASEKFEATPLVVNGVLYTVQPPNDIVALDAATGRAFWVYSYRPSKEARPCCGRINRGLAVLGDMLFMATIDARLIAVDAKSGRPIWNVAVAKPEAGYSFTLAPLVIKDMVIVGTSGGEHGIRGFVAAFDARTGKEIWRFSTIPGPGEPGHETWTEESWAHGGGPVWMTGSYDPDLNLTYWGIGNPGSWNGDVRPGDNLYSNCMVALDADTGRLKWYFQFTPHDEFDFDAVQIPVLADVKWQGSSRKVIFQANRNGFFYVIDRTTGQLLLARSFVKVNWTSGLDEKGRPRDMLSPTTEGTLVYPGNLGATNWYSPSYSPRTGLFYIPTWVDTYMTVKKVPFEYTEGEPYLGEVMNMPIPRRQNPIFDRREEEGYGAIRALDPLTGDLKWQFRMTDVTESGVLTTASDLLFSGGREGYFFALNARTGAVLWKASIGGWVYSGPMTYAVGGRQYVAISAGNVLFSYAVRH
jgi:alcohol dehydrogenase (cytochrome c)